MPTLSTLQARVEKLKNEIDRAEARRRSKLLRLPQKYGFKSLDQVIAALQTLKDSRKERAARPKKAKTAGKVAARRKASKPRAAKPKR